MNKLLRNGLLVALGCSLLGCDPPERSDEGQYWLQVGLEDQLGLDSHRVLVGTELELSIDGVIASEVEPDRLDCIASSASGSLIESGQPSTYRVESAGPGAVEFAAPIDSCPATDDVLSELGVDRWSMRGVEASSAIGKWIGEADAIVLAYDMHPGPAGAFPDAIGRPLDEARIAAGSLAMLRPVLIDASAGERSEIRWHDPLGFITVPAHYQELATHVGPDGALEQQSYLSGSLPAGVSIDPTVTILGHEFQLPSVAGVPTQEILSLELVPIYFPSEEDEREWGLPAGVVAIARDGEGRRILAPPIEWSITRGRLASANENLGSEVLELADCRDEPKRPRWRGATVEARLDDIVASVDLEWVALPTDQIDPTTEQCNGSACDCSSTASPRDSLLAMLALLGLGGLLRRRHSSWRSAASTDPK